jgi:hypothetical protein
VIEFFVAGYAGWLFALRFSWPDNPKLIVTAPGNRLQDAWCRAHFGKINRA